MQHFLKITDYEKKELQTILTLSEELYHNPKPLLQGKNIVFAFEKPSLRTKVGTEIAINKLAGDVIHVDSNSFFEGNVFLESEEKRESLTDTIKNVSQWADAVFARVFSHKTLRFLSEEGDIPIINALCDNHHPMQALADLKTIQDQIGHKKTTIAFIGDSNNVAFSLIEIALKFGHDMRFAGPEEYFWGDHELHHFQTLAEKNGGKFTATTNPKKAAENAKFIYADTFVSMGEEAEHDEKIAVFAPYQINAKIMQKTDNAYFMHCLPAHRGIEVTDEIMDHQNSLIYPLAKNRMITSMGLFSKILTS